MTESKADTYIKLIGEKFAYAAMNVVDGEQWLEFDRINSKTGEVSGHLKVNKSQVVSIEQRQATLV